MDPLVSTQLKHVWQELQPQVTWVWCHTLSMPSSGDILIFFSVDPLELSHSRDSGLGQVSYDPGLYSLVRQSAMTGVLLFPNFFHVRRMEAIALFSIHYYHFYYYTDTVLWCCTCIICLTICSCYTFYNIIKGLLSLCLGRSRSSLCRILTALCQMSHVDSRVPPSLKTVASHSEYQHEWSLLSLFHFEDVIACYFFWIH